MMGESPVKVIWHGSSHLYASMGEALLHILAQVASIHGLACLARDHLAALKLARHKVLLKSLHAQVTSVHAGHHLRSCPLDAQFSPHMTGIAGLCSVRALHEHSRHVQDGLETGFKRRAPFSQGQSGPDWVMLEQELGWEGG